MKRNRFSVKNEENMAKRRKKRIKYKNILILLGIILLLFIVPKKLFSSTEEDILTADVVDTYVGKKIDELEQKVEGKDIKINKSYEYHQTLLKDEIISVDFKEKSIDVVISKGQPDEKLYQEKKVNELGRVPIMMYHGIIDTEDNKYTGGNVDKDGYNRTAKAFREDLEFYYQSGYRMIRLVC